FDNRTLVSGGSDRTLRLWDALTGRELRTFSNRDGSGSLSLFVSPDGRVLPLVSVCPKNSRHALREACSGRAICELHSDWGRGTFALSPDSRVLATWWAFIEMATGTEIAPSPDAHRGGIRSLAFSADGRLLATGGNDTSILIWDWQRLCHLTGEGKP